MKETQVVLQDLRERREWKLPYATTEPPPTDAGRAQQGVATQPEPSTPNPTRKPCVEARRWPSRDKYLQTVVGTVVRVYARAATIDAGGGNTWRVGFALLRRVIDI